MKVSKLNNGQLIGIEVLEIKSIPHINNASYLTEENNIEHFKKILSEFYQIYNNQKLDISLELMLLSEPVSNQTYNANIRFFIIIRALNNNENAIKILIQNILNSIQSSLTLMDYTFGLLALDDFSKVIKQVDESHPCSILKDGKTANLHNTILPHWFVYPSFKRGNLDLSSIYNTMIQYPHCAVSFQLIPVSYQTGEKDFLAQSVQNLKILSAGIVDKSLGTTIKYSSVDNYLEDYEYYLKNIEGVLFKYAINIYGNQQGVYDISNKLFSHLSMHSSNDLTVEELDTNYLHNQNHFIPSPWIYEDVLNEYYDKHYQNYSHLFRNLLNIITLEETVEFFRLPLGNEKNYAGLPIVEKHSTKKTYNEGILNSDNLIIGELNNQTRDQLGISLNDLSKHMLVTGMPGSGKTNFLVGLLDRLWNEYHLPFVVIEPAKSEYRALIDKIPDLQVFSVGKKQVSLFVLNPFLPPKNVHLESYKATLKTAFSAAISLESPLDHIFEETIHNCYADFGWLDSYTSDDGGEVFNIQDFISCFKETFNSIGYSGDAKNIGRAGEVRLNSLVHLFDTYNSISIEDILSKPTVIELNGIENSEQKSLIIALLLLSILSYVNANYRGDGVIKNILLLEEAHVLLDAKSHTLGANPSEIAQDLLKRMLAEMRSYGLGVVIADQSPRKVSEDVVSLTDIKLTFRLVETKDKQIIADSINLEENQISRLSRLKPGQAYFYFHKLDEPEEIITPDYRDNNNIRIFVDDLEIQKRMNYWKKHQDILKPYPLCSLCQSCDYEKKLLAGHIARKIFNKYFTRNTNDVERLKKIIPYVHQLILQELKEEQRTDDYLICTKIHLYRKIKNETRIKINNKLLFQLITK